MKLTIDKLYGEIVVLATYCATANVEYLSSTECANRFKNMLETIKQYKNIEEEVGIDLATLFKALKSGLFVKNKDNKVVEVKDYDRFDLAFDENDEEWVFFMNGEFRKKNNLIHHYYYPKDYGITWALTKEELE